MKITINTSSFGVHDPAPLNQLKKNKIECSLNPHKRVLTEDEIIDLAKGVDGIIAGTEPLNARVLHALPDLKVISRCGVGVDNVDLKTAKDLGIEVFTTPNGPTAAVGELTVGMILNLLRNISVMNQELKSGVWQKRFGNLLYGKRIGIIGFGRIGQKLAQLLSSFEVDIAYSDLENIRTELATPKKEFNDLISWADIITIHTSGSKNGKAIIGVSEIEQMKRGALLVNVSRGGLVDESVLYKALVDGKLAGAALDVFEREPYDGPLKECGNVLLTPHIGSYAMEARVQMEIQAVENLIRGLT